MAIKRTALYFGGVLLIFSSSALADFWSDARGTLGDVGTAVWHTTTAPTEVVINAAQAAVGRQDASEIFSPYQRAAGASGDVVEGGYSLAQQPRQYLYEKAQKYSQKWGGDAGSFIFDVGTFNDSLMTELGTASANSAANVLRGENPFQLVAAPLAAAIRAARDQHYPNSRPLPPDVIAGLQGRFEDATLASARYAVGNVEISLPNFIGSSHEFMGGEIAVTVNDVIVFSSAPPSFSEDPRWWAHEITHIGQYRKWGVERFAWEYVRDLGSAVESNANNYAAYALNPAPNATMPSTAPVYPTQSTTSPYASAFIVQCFFIDTNGIPNVPISFLVNRQSQIIVMNQYTGQWFQVGWATPPRAAGVAWTYTTQFTEYAVMTDGRILWPDRGWMQVGFARLI